MGRMLKCVSLLVFSASIAYSTDNTSLEGVTYQLEVLLETTPGLYSSVEEVLSSQPDTSYWYGITPEEFPEFFNRWLFYDPTPDNPGMYIRYFDALVNSEKGQLLFSDNVFASWFIEFLDARGDYLDTPESAGTMDLWMADTSLHMDDYVVPDGGFATFNQFFLRELASGAKPLDGQGDPSVLVSPADGGIRRIYAENLDTGFQVKRDVINIRQALNNSTYADRFIGGDVVDILLWFTDYHHFHAPVSGEILEIGEYAGSYNYNFEEVNWYQDLARHKRLCYLIQSEEFGVVAMIPVGFWGVGSIINECQVGDYIEKGSELGHFAYGGSSILLVFEPGVIEFDPPVGLENSPCSVRARIGNSTTN